MFEWLDILVDLFSTPRVNRDKWEKEKTKRKKKSKKTKADWYTTEGVGMKETQVAEKTFESERIDRPQMERSATLTEDEKKMLLEKGLDEDKAAKVKPHWAKGKSAATASQIINERGYGERTLDKYWSVFNLLSGEGLHQK